MIDLQAVREAYKKQNIDNVWWIKYNSNLTAELTKINKSDLLQRTMRTGRLDNIADRWVVRPQTSDDYKNQHQTDLDHMAHDDTNKIPDNLKKVA